MTPIEHIDEVKLKPTASETQDSVSSERSGEIWLGRGRRERRGVARGFTLVEALISFALLAIGLVSLASLQTRLRLSADDSRHQAEALRLARNELEMLRLHPDRGDGTLRWEGPSGDIELRSGSSGWPAGALPLRSVSVEALWIDRTGDTRRLLLETVIPSTPTALPAVLLLSDS